MTATEATQKFYALFASGQVEEALERFVAEDAVLENPLPVPIPFGGRFEGRAGFGGYLQRVAEAIEIEQFDIDEVFAEGERVVVLGRETSLVRSTGKRYTMSWVHVLSVRDERIRELREYNDTAAMSAAFAA
jgi:ketosteroid isomerase-like protein